MKFKQIQTAIAQGAAFQPPPEAVTTIVAQQEEWPATLNAIGTVAAVHGVTVSADLPGVVERIGFESGQSVREGDVLAVLDTRQEQAQLAAAEAQRDLARAQLRPHAGPAERARDLAGGVRPRDRRAAAGRRRASARSAPTIERKTIRAPFSGVLGIRQVNLGQYLSAGDALVTLQALDPIYVNFGVPQQAGGQVRAGAASRVTRGRRRRRRSSRAGSPPSTRSSTQATRNVQVQATFANPDGKLRPGMFVQTEVVARRQPARSSRCRPRRSATRRTATRSSSSSDVKGPDGKTYRGVRQQFVKLGGARGDQVAVVSGLKPGEEVVTSGVFKLRNGAAVAGQQQDPARATARRRSRRTAR